jgi:hypothetical protein
MSRITVINQNRQATSKNKHGLFDLPETAWTGVVARVRGTTNTPVVYNAGQAIIFTQLSKISMNAKAHLNPSTVNATDESTFQTGGGFGAFLLPRGDYEVTLYASSAVTGPPNLIFTIQEDGIAQGDSLPLGAQVPAWNTTVFTIEKPYAWVRLTPMQTTTVATEDAALDALVLTITRVGVTPAGLVRS